MTTQQITSQFLQFDRLLHSLSHRCAARCGRPEAEVYGQACYLFTVAANSHDPARGEFGPYMHSCVRNGLASWAVKNDLPPDPDGLPEPSYSRNPARALEIKEWLSGLTEECREVAMLVLNGPTEALEIAGPMTPKAVRGTLVKYLRHNKGWAWPKIWGTLQAVKREVAML